MHFIPLKTEDTFGIRYTHSIHKTDVLEHYKCIDGTRIQMLGMEYESLAIGMPSYAENNQTLTERNGKYFYSLAMKSLKISRFILLIWI